MKGSVDIGLCKCGHCSDVVISCSNGVVRIKPHDYEKILVGMAAEEFTLEKLREERANGRGAARKATVQETS